MDGIATIFRPTMHQIAGFCIYNLKKKFSEADTRGFLHKRRRCLDPDTNFRLARYGVPIVPVLQNDRCARLLRG